MKQSQQRNSIMEAETTLVSQLCDCTNPKQCKCEQYGSNQNVRPSSSSRASSSSQKKKSINDFQQMNQTLGQGSFGWVTLVREISNGKLFAMKSIKKSELFKYCTIDNLKREIKIQRKLNNPYIIKLDSYFEDKLNVYLILEYAEGGSLFKQIKKKRRLSEEETFMHLYQTCLGIDYLHKQKIVHRDLKPENILLDAKGHIKICDFGWSTEMSNLKRAFCGTIEYMAPEMIRSQTTNYKLDIWCLGVLLYEMVQGRPPFSGKNDQEKCNAILSGKPLKYEEKISDDCKNLITTILQQNPFGRPTINQIFNHQWMQSKSKQMNINLYEFTMDIIPTTRSMSDTTNISQNQQINPFQKSKTQTISSTSYRDYQTNQPKQSIVQSTPIGSDRKTTSKEWEQMKYRSQQFIFQPPTQPQQEQGFFMKILVSLGCIQR